MGVMFGDIWQIETMYLFWETGEAQGLYQKFINITKTITNQRQGSTKKGRRPRESQRSRKKGE
jgi:hypothetical protein